MLGHLNRHAAGRGDPQRQAVSLGGGQMEDAIEAGHGLGDQAAGGIDHFHGTGYRH